MIYIYKKSICKRSSLWKQLPAVIQHVNSMVEFNQMLTNDIIKSLRT